MMFALISYCLRIRELLASKAIDDAGIGAYPEEHDVSGRLAVPLLLTTSGWSWRLQNFE